MVAHRLPTSQGMKANPGSLERRTHLNGRTQFEAFRRDLERRLRRIYDGEWPHGFDDMIARIARARVRENFGLRPQH
jgi:hypothetical protein